MRAAREAGNSRLEAYECIVQSIQEDHLQSAETYIKSVEIFEDLARHIRQQCRELRLDLAAAQRIGESPGFADRIISRGEILSSHFVAALLQDRGIDSRFVNLSEVIKFEVTNGLDHPFYQRLAVALAEEAMACGDQVPVMTGYWGNVPGK